LISMPVQAAQATDPAADEYVLKLPGVTQSESSVSETPSHPTDRGNAAAGSSGIQRGVVGETEAPSTPLAAAGETLPATPASLLIGGALLLAASLVTFRARRYRGAGT
jgi:hypothetical protein